MDAETTRTDGHGKTATFQMRINPAVKKQAEDLYAGYGLTLTDAVNIFIRQSLREEGLPFLLSPENETRLREKAMARMMAEVEKGWQSAEEGGWLTLEQAAEQIGVSIE